MNELILIRIVQLTLHPDRIDAFLSLFDTVSPRIRSFEGCTHLELLQHEGYDNVVSTYSHWQSPENLEAYRNSPLFKSTWKETRAMFAAPPQAVSFYRIRHLD